MLFPLSVFLSATLLFFVEPMFARMVLPKLGGAPAVWNTCVVFYQSMLLAGYAYAHLLARTCRVRTQALVHLAVLTTAIVVLPIGVDAAWTPTVSANPVGSVFVLLTTALGLPFFALSASGPLLQQWFVLKTRGQGNAYALYASSNVGSFVALLAYPFLVEPWLPLHVQSQAWAGGYVVLVALAAACAWAAIRTTGATSASDAASASGTVDAATQNAAPVPSQTASSGARIAAAAAGRTATSRDAREVASDATDDPWMQRLQWVGLAFVPSSLMLSVTTFMSTDIAAIPLLWIVPLAIYLATLIVAFASRQILPRSLVDFLAPTAVVGIVALVLVGDNVPVTYAIALHMGAFAVVALTCHLEMASIRPDVSRLTEFYLWISAGGAIGGIFNTLIAPQLFVTPVEYPLAAIATCLLFSGAVAWPSDTRGRVVSVVVTLLPVALLFGCTYAVRHLDWSFLYGRLRWAAMGGPALLACVALWGTPVRMGIALALVMLAGTQLRYEDRVTLHIERTFFGVHRVTFNGPARVLMSGTTNHGSQSTNPEYRCEPLTYYARSGPIGQVFESFKQGRPRTRFGVVGLGTATMAAYAKPGDDWTFFEINPVVERIARDPQWFTYLRDCAPGAKVVLGDARLSLEREPDGSFDLLVLDAFSSDAIPVHLMTTEAVALYMRKLAPDGVLALHISNRYLDLTTVVGAIATELHLNAITQMHEPAHDEPLAAQIAVSRWALLARPAEGVEDAVTGGSPHWEVIAGSPEKRWTDDYSNVVGLLRWRYR